MSKHILLAVTGGIAAYKACEIVRLLKKQGHTVTVAMSEAACNFITPQTMQALSGNPVLTQNGGGGNQHDVGGAGGVDVRHSAACAALFG